MKRDVIVACDFSSKEDTLQFLDLFQDKKPYVKIGMELYYSCGPTIVKEIKQRGHKIFLDLKLHDIPNTVQKTMKSLAQLNVDMINLHAAGGVEMMKAALVGLEEGSKGNRPLLIAVTQLTSTDETIMRDELLIPHTIKEAVQHYAKMTQIAKLDGVVCSPLEAKYIQESCGNEFITVTPGIRFSTHVTDDQKRITTPNQAREIGSTFIVVGRPITNAANPVEAYNQCIEEFCN